MIKLVSLCFYIYNSKWKFTNTWLFVHLKRLSKLLEVHSFLFVWVFLEKDPNLYFVLFTMITFEMLINYNPSYSLFFPSKILFKLNIN